MKNRHRSTLFLVLALILIAGAVWLKMEFVRKQASERELVESQIVLLEKQLEVRERELAELRRLKSTRNSADLVLQADTAALAGASLQGMVNKIVEEAGGYIKSTQYLPKDPGDPFSEIDLRLQIESSNAGLRDMIRNIEGNKPILIVHGLEIAALNGFDGGNIGNALDVTLDVRAFAALPRTGQTP